MIDLHGGDDGAAEDLAEGVTITGRRGRAKVAAGGDAGVIVKGAPDVWVKLAKCCTPVPPDPILGFVTKGGGSLGAPRRLHQRRQPAGPARAAARGRVGADRRSRRSWSTSRSRRSTAPGCSPTSPWCSPTRTSNILSANLSTTRDRVAKSRFTFEMADAKHLDTVLKAVRSVARRLRRLPRHPVGRSPSTAGHGRAAGLSRRSRRWRAGPSPGTTGGRRGSPRAP